MNAVTHTVVSIGKPYNAGYRYWAVDVEADAWGSIQKSTRYFGSKEAALKLKVGDKFEA